MDVQFFTSPQEFREWLRAHHDQAQELWIGFYKKGSGKVGITPAEALDEALCFGWIDGVRRRLDDERYVNRYSPRRRGSNWSEINTKRAHELLAEGRMQPAGLKAFAARDAEKSTQYSYEARSRGLADAYEARFRASAGAWAFWEAQPPSYRKTASWWVMSAKKEETRLRRLATLIDDSAHGRRIALLRRATETP
jgi:uncharacterized protein YdeI (YjbR/CyaY-like superfamily)